jgi:hypothetical protein
MVPQVFAVTSVAQAKVQVTAVLLLPVTEPVNCCVLLVITLAVVGVTVMATVVELLLPQPRAPSAAAKVSIVENFHHLIPILPKFFNIRPRGTSVEPLPAAGTFELSHVSIKFRVAKSTIKTSGSR